MRNKAEQSREGNEVGETKEKAKEEKEAKEKKETHKKEKEKEKEDTYLDPGRTKQYGPIDGIKLQSPYIICLTAVFDIIFL